MLSSAENFAARQAVQGASPEANRFLAPFEQAAQRPSAVLRPLEVEWLPRRERAWQLAAERFAEMVNLFETVH